MTTAGSRSNVIWRRPVASVRITHRLPCPPLSERKTSSAPSRLTDGVCARPVCRVTRTAFRMLSVGVPATGNLHLSDCPRRRPATNRPARSTSGSTLRASPNVSCWSCPSAVLTIRRLNTGGYSTVLPYDELYIRPEPSGSHENPCILSPRATSRRSPFATATTSRRMSKNRTPPVRWNAIALSSGAHRGVEHTSPWASAATHCLREPSRAAVTTSGRPPVDWTTAIRFPSWLTSPPDNAAVTRRGGPPSVPISQIVPSPSRLGPDEK